MNISITLAHPTPESFNHAIAATAAETLRLARHHVTLHDLYQEGFDPVLPGVEIPAGATLPTNVARHCEEVAQADGLVFVHPNWWGMPPALLKGWVDRVLRPGVAYEFVGDDQGEGVPVGLLKARVAVVFNTANTPAEREQKVFGDPLETLWKNCIFDLCGVRRTHRRIFGVVVTSTPEQRRTWLAEVRSLLDSCFPADT